MLDLQSVIAHEYGHCLGLAHSQIVGATMFPSAPGTLAARSLHADDQANLQLLYGAVSPTKPHIDSVNRVGTDQLRIVGRNFDAANNEVVFNQGVVVGGVSALNGGTEILVAIPSNALPGDVQVFGSDPAAGAKVSNAYPFDPSGCPYAATYCTAKASSTGCTPSITFQGSASASDPTPFLIEGSSMLNQSFGLVLYALTPANTPFNGGTLCLGAPLKRTLVQATGGNPPPNDCTGTLSLDFNARIQSGVDPALVAGQGVYAQVYFRDPPDAFGVGLTDALAFTICP
jgi:hypothetical protein